MSDANNTVEAADALSHVPILRSLEAKVAPRHTALIVIDVQNDFCAPGGMMDKEGLDLSLAQAMGDRMPALIDAARKAGKEAEQDAAGRGSALVGKETPDCRIVRVEDGAEVSLRALEAAGRPLVLNFGSCS